MKNFILSSAAFVVATFAGVAQTSQADMEKAWAEYMTPGEIHKMLAKDDGTWEEDMTVWMAPGAEPVKSKMTAVNKMILGGRYQESRHSGDFMGMPFEGISTVGFDNASKKMVSTWVDNMGTGIMHMQGAFDGKSKSIEFTGKCIDPITKKEKPLREIYTMVDDDTRKMEMFDVTPDGKEYKSMEITMRRKK